MFNKTNIILEKDALPGRKKSIVVCENHYISGNLLYGDLPKNLERCVIGMGCFWGAERLFWKIEGVYSTSVGYCGGFTINPTYEEVCSGKTGHTEVVQIIFNPEIVSYDYLIKVFFENHNPTEYMRQGNDIGTQYRSAIFTFNDSQKNIVIKIKEKFEQRLVNSGFGEIVTEINDCEGYYFAEEYHQQYLAKNKNGYCGLKGTGVYCV